MCCEKGETAIASFNCNHWVFLFSGLSLKWAETTVYTRPSGLSELLRSRRGEMEAEATSVHSFCQNSATPSPGVWGGESSPAFVAMLFSQGFETGGVRFKMSGSHLLFKTWGGGAGGCCIQGPGPAAPPGDQTPMPQSLLRIPRVGKSWIMHVIVLVNSGLQNCPAG